MSTDKLPCKNPKAVADSELEIPVCAACQFGKACRRTTRSSKTKPVADKQQELKKGDVFPGQRVSVDHYQSAVPGRLYSSRGSTKVEDMYCEGSIFADHASGYLAVRHQVSLSAADTIKAKLSYDQEARDNGVTVQGFHTDNGVFTSREFMTHLAESKQSVRFSGAGAAHQNGVAERAIRTVTEMACTIMIHAAMKSPDGTITAELWPMAMDHAVWVYNHMPKEDTGLTPAELWARSTYIPVKELFGRCHPWGCPTYILEPKLQKGGIKIPKWQPCSRRGAFMGFSRWHSATVALVLNLLTKSISPQYHVILDDYFSSVYCNTEKVPSIWKRLITSSSARI